jgi:hypothetical protein
MQANATNILKDAIRTPLMRERLRRASYWRGVAMATGF